MNIRSRSCRIKCFLICAITIFLATSLLAQDRATGVALYGNYSYPLAGLKEWFKPAYNFGVAAGSDLNSDWYLEGLVEYVHFKDENLNGYPEDKLELSLEHIGLLANGRYFLIRRYWMRSYFNIGAGIYYWKGRRGKIDADASMEPAIPLIEEKILEEWNWGFRSGAGIEFFVIDDLNIDICGYYQFIVGDLWPTMQPHIELEGVSGFQTLNLALVVRYYFN